MMRQSNAALAQQFHFGMEFGAEVLYGRRRFRRVWADAFGYFQRLTRCVRVGYTSFIYYASADEAGATPI